MSKNVIVALIAFVAVAGVTGVVIVNNNSKHMDMSHTSQSGSTSQGGTTFANGKDMSTDKVQSGEVKMDIANFAFTQKTLKVKKGTKVTWTNTDSARHDVSPEDESASFMGSELLAKGKSYSFTFDTAGKYAYKCSPHPYMKASVEVIE